RIQDAISHQGPPRALPRLVCPLRKGRLDSRSPRADSEIWRVVQDSSVFVSPITCADFRADCCGDPFQVPQARGAPACRFPLQYWRASSSAELITCMGFSCTPGTLALAG